MFKWLKRETVIISKPLIRAVSIEEQAVEAQRLLDSETVSIILDVMRSEALEMLANETDSNDANEIVRLQSAVTFVDGFRVSCARMILRAKEAAKKPVDPT